jgi:hypothetical protein
MRLEPGISLLWGRPPAYGGLSDRQTCLVGQAVSLRGAVSPAALQGEGVLQ